MYLVDARAACAACSEKQVTKLTTGGAAVSHICAYLFFQSIGINEYNIFENFLLFILLWINVH